MTTVFLLNWQKYKRRFFFKLSNFGNFSPAIRGLLEQESVTFQFNYVPLTLKMHHITQVLKRVSYVEFKKKLQILNCQRTSQDAKYLADYDGRKSIAIGHLSDSGDLINYKA